MTCDGVYGSTISRRFVLKGHRIAAVAMHRLNSYGRTLTLRLNTFLPFSLSRWSLKGLAFEAPRFSNDLLLFELFHSLS